MSGRVVDAGTGGGIGRACVFAGNAPICPTPNLNTDANGNFAVDLPAGVQWRFYFLHPLYQTKDVFAPIGQPGNVVSLGTIQLPRR